jgi:hypothetical protein
MYRLDIGVAGVEGHLFCRNPNLIQRRYQGLERLVNVGRQVSLDGFRRFVR